MQKNLFVAVTLLFLLPYSGIANEKQAALIAKLEPATVKINCLYQGVPVNIGTGFFISDDGKILTNMHVVRPAFQEGYALRITTNDGKQIEDVSMIKVGDEKNVDLTLLKVNFHPKSFFKIATIAPKKGTDVMVLGNPRGYDFTVSSGILSGFNQADTSAKFNPESRVDEIQVTAPISPGNSGGPIFNDVGEVLGVATEIRLDAGSENLNFGISYTEINKFLANQLPPEPLPVFQKARHARIKATYENLKNTIIRPLIVDLDHNKLGDREKGPIIALYLDNKSIEAPIPNVFTRNFSAKRNCKIAGDARTSIADCYDPGSNVSFTFQISKMHVDDLKVSNGNNKLEVKPLPIVVAIQRSGEWETLKKKLSPQQIKYLYSIPEPWKCKQEKASARPMWNLTTTCARLTYNDGAAGASTFFYAAHRNNDPYAIFATVNVPDSAMSSFYFELPVYMIGATEFKKDN